MTVNMPADEAISAARSLVAMPPVPFADPAPRLDESTRCVVSNNYCWNSIYWFYFGLSAS